jgi:hypothetical protein
MRETKTMHRGERERDASGQRPDVVLGHRSCEQQQVEITLGRLCEDQHGRAVRRDFAPEQAAQTFVLDQPVHLRCGLDGLPAHGIAVGHGRVTQLDQLTGRLHARERHAAVWTRRELPNRRATLAEQRRRAFCAQLP